MDSEIVMNPKKLNPRWFAMFSLFSLYAVPTGDFNWLGFLGFLGQRAAPQLPGESSSK